MEPRSARPENERFVQYSVFSMRGSVFTSSTRIQNYFHTAFLHSFVNIKACLHVSDLTTFSYFYIFVLVKCLCLFHGFWRHSTVFIFICPQACLNPSTQESEVTWSWPLMSSSRAASQKPTKKGSRSSSHAISEWSPQRSYQSTWWLATQHWVRANRAQPTQLKSPFFE